MRRTRKSRKQPTEIQVTEYDPKVHGDDVVLRQKRDGVETWAFKGDACCVWFVSTLEAITENDSDSWANYIWKLGVQSEALMSMYPTYRLPDLEPDPENNLTKS